MAITELSLPALFQGRRFVIPRYQRHYAWDDTQCQALIDDLDMLDIKTPKHIRFMGYITTIAVHSDPLKTKTHRELEERQVIDDQQRLISISLLLAAIVKKLEKNSPEDARGLRSDYLVTEMVNGGKLPRLLLQELPGFSEKNENGPVRSLFLDLIGNNNNNNSKEKAVNIPAMTRMQAASRLFDKHVEKLNEEQLSNLLTKLQARTVFGLNEATSLSNAEDIFEGLNNRGKPLSDLERIKSHAAYAVTSFVQQNKQVLVKSKELSREEFVEFTNQQIGITYHSLDQRDLGKPSLEADLILAHYPIIRFDISSLEINGKNESENFERGVPSEYFLNSVNLKTAKTKGKQINALTGCYIYLESLAKTAPLYADIRAPTHPESFVDIQDKNLRKEVVTFSDLLHYLRKSVHYAPILLAYRTIKPNNANGYLKLTKAIESLAFWTVGLGRGEIGKSTVEQWAENLVSGEIDLDKVVMDCNSRAARTILRRAQRQLKFTDNIPTLIRNGNIKELSEAIAWAINNNELRKNIESLMLFEYSNRSKLVFKSRDAVIKSYISNERLFFTRIRAPEKGSRPVQLGLEKTSAQDRHAWARHPSNIIPAVNDKQKDLVKQLDLEYRNDKKKAHQWSPERLLSVGVDSSLLPNRITISLADKLVNEFNEFVIQRWAPDISGQAGMADIEFEDDD